MKSKSYLLCIALLAVCPGLLMADDPAGDPKTLSPEALRTEVAALNRHFPFGFRLEPIQARNVSYFQQFASPPCLARGDSSTFSSLRPRFLGSYTWNMLL